MMPTGQSFIKLDEDMAGRETMYITIGHMPCRTKRTFKITETMQEILDSKADGLAISTECETCKTGVLVQIFVAKDIERGFSYGTKIQTDVGYFVQDDNGLKIDSSLESFKQ